FRAFRVIGVEACALPISEVRARFLDLEESVRSIRVRGEAFPEEGAEVDDLRLAPGVPPEPCREPLDVPPNRQLLARVVNEDRERNIRQRPDRATGEQLVLEVSEACLERGVRHTPPRIRNANRSGGCSLPS